MRMQKSGTAASLTRRAHVALALVALGACGEPSRYPVVSGPRDWGAHPAVVALDAPEGAPIYAVSDVHGGYDRLVALLARHGLIVASPPAPEAVRWRAGGATLVVVGDAFDKGPEGLEVLDLLRALEVDARAAGGAVVCTLGNHEAEFLADPENDKAAGADGVDREIRARGITPEAIASGQDPRGRWLRERPFAARVGRWFFAHAGDTHGRSVASLEQALRAAVNADDYRGAEVVGAGSILESRGWYASDGGIALRYARAVGAEHIVFGHDPNALGARGRIAVAQGGALLRIDCGMSPDVNDSAGALLRVRTEAGVEVAESLAADGSVRELWRSQGG